MKSLEKSRFDTRLSKDQKACFEYAASLGGFKSLAEFFIFSAQKQAADIVEKHNSILISKKDQEVFFNAVMVPPKPNSKLKKAVERFNKAVATK
jgi:uncharacterized protein (DUF1778 family)